MIVYHGTNTVIEKPDLRFARERCDFGKGFYTTGIIDQAQRWARRMAQLRGGAPTVNAYEYAPNKSLKILQFHQPNADWAQFVLRNREGLTNGINNLSGQYDIVIGEVADDKMFDLFLEFQSRKITVQQLADHMRARINGGYQQTHQISLHTEAALRLLKFLGHQQA